MILGYLMFAHLLGDFIFQPTSLVQWKMKSKNGVFVHVLIHFAISALIIMPFIINGYFWLLGIIAFISFTHFWIDQAKINYNIKHDQKVKPFIIDQLLHLVTLLVIYFFIANIPLQLPTTYFYQLYSDAYIIIFLSLIVFVSTVIEIYHFQKQREKNARAQLKMNSSRVLTRITVFTVLYIVFVLIGFYARGVTASL